MGLDTKQNPILYSIGTHLAYKIAKRYYKNVHYVWCTTEFNVSKQPPTSNPSKYVKDILNKLQQEIDIQRKLKIILLVF